MSKYETYAVGQARNQPTIVAPPFLGKEHHTLFEDASGRRGVQVARITDFRRGKWVVRVTREYRGEQ